MFTVLDALVLCIPFLLFPTETQYLWSNYSFIWNEYIKQTESRVLHSLWSGRIWRCHWRPSTAGCRHTPQGWGRTDNPCSLVSHISPTLRSPPGSSCSGWSKCAGRHSRCCSCSSGPGISSPQKMLSGEKQENRVSSQTRPAQCKHSPKLKKSVNLDNFMCIHIN